MRRGDMRFNRDSLKPAAALSGALGFILLILCHAVGAAPALALDLALIEPADLARNEGGWVVLDARPKADWRAGCIPGACSFSWEDLTGTDEKGASYQVKPPKDLAEALGAMGIDENAPVAVYGDAEKSWGGEGWACWLLAWLGHKGPIRLLSGGVQSWREQGLPMSAGGEETARPVRLYHTAVRPELDIQASELQGVGGSMALVDTRSTIEWWKGHLPGAVHIPWTEFYSGEDKKPLGRDALLKLLKEHGVSAEKPVVYYCAGGVRSGYAWMVHRICMLQPARNYKGGMEEWKRYSSE